MTSLGRNVRTLVQATRLFSSSAAKNEVHPVYFKQKALQKKYRALTNVPVHLLGGTRDKVLLYITHALMAWVIFDTVRTLYGMAQK